LTLLKSPLTVIMCLYVLIVAVSSSLGVAPYVSLLGSFENQMGLLTQVCCFVCLVALVTGIGSSATLTIHRVPAVVLGSFPPTLAVGWTLTIHRLPSVVFEKLPTHLL
jgi:hypothetical protein